MKISSLQENLKSGLSAVNHIAGKNINLPILNNVLIDAKDGNIKLVTTDLEIGIIANVRGKVEENGLFTVDARVLTDFISLLPNKKIDISKKENKIYIKSENYSTVIKGQDAEDFPLIPSVDKNNVYKAAIDDFKKALSQVIFAVSTSETRVELSGVLFCFTGENLVMAATDSYRLAEKIIKVESSNREGDEKKIIVPAKTLQEVIRILSSLRSEDLGEGREKLEMYASENQIMFKVGGIELVSRLIEGQYPDYKQIIPMSHETAAIASRQELIRAVKAAAIFSKSGINDINLDFPSGKNQIIVSSASSQTGENITELEAAVNGKDNGIVINYRFLLDGLNNVTSENVKMEVINNNTPCIIKQEKDDDYVYIIMPIKQ